MSQEIELKLKADTREAVKSVKDLEKQMSNMENIESKGNMDNGFLSQEDVRRFQRQADQAERIYKQFFEKYNKIEREFEKKKRELEEARKRNPNSTTTEQLEREVNEVDSRRKIYQSQVETVEDQRRQIHQTQQNVNDMNTPGVMNNMLMATRKLLPMLGVTLAAGQLIGFAKDGARQIKVDENYMSKLGQQVPGFNGDYEKGRLQAQDVGLKDGNAYSAIDTMQTGATYSNLAGAKDSKELWTATNEIQTMSRVTGMDPNELAQQSGTLVRNGTFDAKSLKGFRESMVGAIKETGMAGRDREFINAVTGLSEQVGSGQMKFSKDEFNQLLGLQTILGESGKPGLQGQKGADVLGQIDAGVKGNDNAVDLMLGWGSEYQGIEGRAELERLKAKGISDPEVAQKLFSNIDKLGGGNKDYQALFLKDKFNLSMEQADALLEDDTLDKLKKGGMSKKEINAIIKDGGKESDKKQKDWTESQAQRREENDVKWENTKKFGGSPLDKAWNWGKEQFLGQSEGAQWAEMIGGAGLLGLGGVLGGKKLFNMIGNRKVGGAPKAPWWKNIKKPSMPSVPGGASSVLKGGLGVLGSAVAMKEAGDAGGGVGDWFFGHEKGQTVSSWNPFETETYKEDKQGALSKTWDFVTPWQTGSEKEKAKEEDKKKEEKAEKEHKPKKEEKKADKEKNKDKENAKADEKKADAEKGKDEKEKDVGDINSEVVNINGKVINIMGQPEKEEKPMKADGEKKVENLDAKVLKQDPLQTNAEIITNPEATDKDKKDDAKKLVNQSQRTKEVEKANIDAKDKQLEKEMTLLDHQRKNIDDSKMVKEFGGFNGQVSRTSATEAGGGQGIFGKLMGGLLGGLSGGGGILGGLLTGGGTFMNAVMEGMGLGGGKGGGDTDISGDFTGNSNAQVAWNFFKSKGFTDQAAAGILGNLQQESGIDPTKKQNGGGPGRGIMQWEAGGRWDQLTSWAKQNGKDANSMETQLQYMWLEMNGKDSTGASKLKNKYGGMEGLKSANDSKWATQAFEDSFERAGKPNYANRYKYTDGFLNKFGGTQGTWNAQTSQTMTGNTNGSIQPSNNNTQKLEVTVGGNIDGMSKENNNAVTTAITEKIKSSAVSIAYEFRQGLGGNR